MSAAIPSKSSEVTFMEEGENARSPQSSQSASGSSGVSKKKGPPRLQYLKSQTQGSLSTAKHTHGSISTKKTPHSALSQRTTSQIPQATSLKPGGLLGNIHALRENAHDSLHKTAYNVNDLYHTEGMAQMIARSEIFSNITLGVISVNAVWLGIDAESNPAETVAKSEIQFQIAEHLFTAYFTAEILIRFLAFERKMDAVRDRWFKFDGMLCVPMIFETWMLPLFAGGSKMPLDSTDTSMLRIFRLVRLSRMMRLLRCFPELITLLKGMAAAVRSVSSTLSLLVVFMYIFAIIFRQQARGSEELEEYFGSMGQCFWTLLLQGTLLDNITAVLAVIRDDSPGLAALFILFMLLGNFTILNMLIGVLCEVVAAVGVSEKEKRTVQYAKDSFLSALVEMDKDGSGTISQEEFVDFVNQPSIRPAFEELGVDREGLLSFADEIFSAGALATEEELSERERQLSNLINPEIGQRTLRRSERVLLTFGRSLKFGEVLEHILTLRSSNSAMVKDIVDLRKFVRQSTNQTTEIMMHVARMQKQLLQRLYDDESNAVSDFPNQQNWKQMVHAQTSPHTSAASFFESLSQPEGPQNAAEQIGSPTVAAHAHHKRLGKESIAAHHSSRQERFSPKPFQHHTNNLCSISEAETLHHVTMGNPTSPTQPAQANEKAVFQTGSKKLFCRDEPSVTETGSNIANRTVCSWPADKGFLQAEVEAALDERMSSIVQNIRSEVLKFIQQINVPMDHGHDQGTCPSDGSEACPSAVYEACPPDVYRI